MARTKNKNDYKITNIKKNNVVIKKGAKVTTINKKSYQPKKKLEIVDEVKKNNVTVENNVKKNIKKKTNTNISSKPIENKKQLSQEEIIAQRKERNRRKYQNQQKKYQDNKKIKEKKKIEIFDESDFVVDNNQVVQEENLVKKVKEQEEEKEQTRKEKRKTNRKSVFITQTITSIKTISVNTVNNVKEKTDDKNIPVGTTIEEKSKRSKRLIKESIVYAVILTVIDVLCILIFDNFNFLRLFDVKWLNVVVTILIGLIFNFFVAFMIDYFVTEIWLKKKRKKDGEQDGDNRTIEEEYRENIENKEGE